MNKNKLILCAFLFYNCSMIVDTSSRLLIKDTDEWELGEEFHSQLLDSNHIYKVFQHNDDPDKKNLVTYINSVFQTVLNAVPMEERPDYFDNFTLTIIDDDVINAFAVPGGKIYLYTGIIKALENESELAGILGHEISHVTLHHYRKQAVEQAMVSIVINAVAGKENGALTEFIANSFLSLAAAKVSRKDELEADQYGTKYLYNSKRDPYGISSFFEREKDAPGVLVWLSSHPNPSERVDEIKKYVSEESLNEYVGENYKYKFDSLTSTLK